MARLRNTDERGDNAGVSGQMLRSLFVLCVSAACTCAVTETARANDNTDYAKLNRSLRKAASQRMRRISNSIYDQGISNRTAARNRWANRWRDRYSKLWQPKRAVVRRQQLGMCQRVSKALSYAQRYDRVVNLLTVRPPFDSALAWRTWSWARRARWYGARCKNFSSSKRRWLYGLFGAAATSRASRSSASAAAALRKPRVRLTAKQRLTLRANSVRRYHAMPPFTIASRMPGFYRARGGQTLLLSRHTLEQTRDPLRPLLRPGQVARVEVSGKSVRYVVTGLDGVAFERFTEYDGRGNVVAIRDATKGAVQCSKRSACNQVVYRYKNARLIGVDVTK